jgi:hypothetical protein
MDRANLTPLAGFLAVLAISSSTALAAPVNFSGISAGLVTTATGQDFPYTIGSGPATGTLNVRYLSGDITTLTTGQSPDPTGFYVLQSPALAPVTFRFTLDGKRGLRVNSNETLTAREQNTFTLPAGSPSWSIVAVSNATIASTSDAVTFTGTLESPPYGQFAIQTITQSFDFTVVNIPGYPIYGSALSIDVVDVATPVMRSSWGRVKQLFR